MAFNKKAGVAAFTLALLLMAYCTEAVRICWQKSQHFRGDCVSNKFCATTCAHEEGGFTSGFCSKKRRGIFWGNRICKCTKRCDGHGGEDPLPPEPPGGEEPSPPRDKLLAVSGRTE